MKYSHKFTKSFLLLLFALQFMISGCDSKDTDGEDSVKSTDGTTVQSGPAPVADTPQDALVRKKSQALMLQRDHI